MKTSVFLKTQYGVTVELRQWGERECTHRWLDRYGCEWRKLHDSETWESQSYNKVSAVEIGRWTSDTTDVYEAVKLAGSNTSGFRNFGAL